MKKITFEDHSYIEIIKQNTGKIMLTIVARENSTSATVIANSVELTKDQFNQLVKGIDE